MSLLKGSEVQSHLERSYILNHFSTLHIEILGVLNRGVCGRDLRLNGNQLLALIVIFQLPNKDMAECLVYMQDLGGNPKELRKSTGFSCTYIIENYLITTILVCIKFRLSYVSGLCIPISLHLLTVPCD